MSASAMASSMLSQTVALVSCGNVSVAQSTNAWVLAAPRPFTVRVSMDGRRASVVSSVERAMTPGPTTATVFASSLARC